MNIYLFLLRNLKIFHGECQFILTNYINSSLSHNIGQLKIFKGYIKSYGKI